ncbi:hypothetical protein U8527_07190 [Kordia algicida OT-1]|uniref:Uncharacterized protein n=1 Tax=Kordia algicida OT-1 TaxID=391587 RepID=A9E9D9_9FLAO|nr:hypothetical protein [Kordia algicida]EDP94663.1 hypothetical protein KAOT1_00265 [Kordia algicida OT-1]EDP94729.1 hypothetical protein KAOT1_00595 [Kordia algicida OT-1]
MGKNSDIAWKPIMYMVGTGVAGILIGTLIVAPWMQKAKAKKLAEKKKQVTAKK